MAKIISTSKKEIYSKLMDIAGKYTDIENSDFAKTGLFGYITESMAMAMRDSTFHTSMMYNESFLNTAIIPKSVYNWAKMFNIEVQKASPAYANISLILDSDSLSSGFKPLSSADTERYGIQYQTGSDQRAIIIDKETPITVGDYTFMLEHSIMIEQKDAATNSSSDQNTGNTQPTGTVYTAKYIVSEYESTNYQGINNTNNNLEIKYSDGNYTIFARAYQYKLRKFDRQLTTSTFLNKIQRYEFEDQFCSAKLFTRTNGELEEINLSYSDINLPDNVLNAFYNLSSDNELEINFKYGADNYFMPGVNSNIITYVYTTKGRNVPTKFSGTASIRLTDTRFSTLPLLVELTDGNIIGGKNIPSLSDIKDTIISEISTRNTITTQADLNNYFGVVTSLVSSVNNGRVSFIKQRDDIIRRIYNAYLLLRDNTNDTTGESITSSFISPCVPTNTINVLVANQANTVTIGDTESIVDLSSASSVTYNLSYPKFLETMTNGTYAYSSNTITGGYYICPFKIKVMTKPVKSIAYTYDLVNNSSKMDYYTAGTSDFFTENYMLPGDINVKKDITSFTGGSTGNKYNFTLTTTTNFPASDVENKTIKLSGSSSNISVTGCDISSVATDDSLTSYVTTIKFSLYVNGDSVENNTVSLKVGTNGTPASFKFKDRLKISFDEFVVKDKSISKSLTGLEFISAEELVLVQDLSGIMESPITVTTKSDKTQSIIIKDLPVIHSSFLNESENNKLDGFTEQLFTYIQLLQDNLDRLETSTFFSLKFYNTYGTSYKYETQTTNLDLVLKITLGDEYKTNNDSLKKQITSYIRRVVDKSNETGYGWRYSDLVSSVLGAFNTANDTKIVNIDFAGVNNTYNQFIKPVDASDVYEEYTTRTPEWLNLDSETIDTSITFV